MEPDGGPHSVSRPRLTRVSLDHLTESDPGLRRPAVDRLGDALGADGVVRVQRSPDSAFEVEDLVEVLGSSLEDYFGLPAGTLVHRIDPALVIGSNASSGVVAVLVRGHDVSDEAGLTVTTTAGGEVRWRASTDEVLVLVGPLLARWTAGVLPGSIDLGSDDLAPFEPRYVVGIETAPQEVLPGFQTASGQSGLGSS